jgi:RNA recognition motif-containing protein
VRVNWAFQKEEKEEVAHHFHAFVGDLSSGGWEPRACRASVVVCQLVGCGWLVGGMAGWMDGGHWHAKWNAAIECNACPSLCPLPSALIPLPSAPPALPALPALSTTADVTDAMLLGAFQNCPGCSDARVMWDHATGRSRGFGFVSFRHREEAEAAIQASVDILMGLEGFGREGLGQEGCDREGWLGGFTSKCTAMWVCLFRWLVGMQMPLPSLPLPRRSHKQHPQQC